MSKTLLYQANQLFRQKQYASALQLYSQILEQQPPLASFVRFNIQLAQKRVESTSEAANHFVVENHNEYVIPSPAVDMPPKSFDYIAIPESLNDYEYEQIKNSGLFQPDWYLSTYQTRFDIQGNPLAHYLEHGVSEKLNPSPGFDTDYYLNTYPDIALAGIHPFIHYVCQGIKEGRNPVPPASELVVFSDEVEEATYVSRLPHDNKSLEQLVKVIAFYLPQFHAIPENDEWWGNGFTEWTNVIPAAPQFREHYQPHVPDDYLGYYNLLDQSVQRKQVELAKQYGINGFCFYLYWFSGKRLLEQPLDNYLNDSSLDLPFCVCWANENWSRRWDGLDQDLLMVQNYSKKDDLAFIEEVSKYLRDPRYIRVDSKPLLIIYRPNLFPDIRATVKRWRKWCLNNGIGEIYLAYTQSFECVDPAKYGFDAAIEFPPNNSNPPNITKQVDSPSPDFQGQVFDWRVFIERSKAYVNPGYKLFRGACPSWDNTARKKSKGFIFKNSSPRLFSRWLENAFTDTVKRIDNADERLVFVNAWNEWAEGAHLEPDEKYGYAWLQAVRDAHEHSYPTHLKGVMIVTHDCHPHGAQFLILETARKLKDNGFDVFILALSGGRLIDDFRQIGRVLNAEEAGKTKLDGFLAELRENGVSDAITSTVVSGSVVPVLKSQGFRVLSLIHELPGVIRDMRQEGNAENIAQYSDKVVFPAELVRQEFETIAQITPEKIIIRPQGLLRRNPYKKNRAEAYRKICEKHQLPKDCQIVLSIGYVDFRKGADLFVEMANRVLRVKPNTVFIWVGHFEAQMQKTVSDRIVALNQQARILFVGFDKDPMAYYAAASVYALTSREDPFPNVVLESAEVNVPVVAFQGASGANDFVIEQGGRLAKYECEDDFALKVIELLSEPQRTHYTNVASLKQYALDLMHYLNGSLRVSVVVPNYNYAKLITERLESIRHQTYPIYELFVLDDASSDNSAIVIQEYLDNTGYEGQLIVNEKNSGSVFRQWKKGVAHCKGDLVWIAEADDLSDNTFLEELVKGYADPALVLAFSQSKQMDENGNILAENYLSYTKDVADDWQSDYVHDGLDEIRNALCIKNTIPNVSAVVFKRAALEHALEGIGEKLLEYRVAGDWMVYMHILKKGKIYFNAKSLNMHRRHTNSVTQSTNKLGHYREVCGLQDAALEMAPHPSDLVLAKVHSYRKYLLRHFNL